MAQKGGTGHANADVIQSLEIKATSSQIIFDSTSANTTTLQDSATAARVITFPDATDTLTGNTATQTLTNKSITSPTITGSPTAATATWTNLGSVTTIDINGGTIDNVTIGGTTPTAGTFTSVSTSAQAGVALSPFNTAAGNTGETRYIELAANGTNYVGFKAPDAITTNVIWTLPAADGTSGQQLTTNGSGILTWTASDANNNTLDQAYDQGGAGAGRTITADSGAVAITATSADGDDLLDIDHTASGALTANTTDTVAIDASRTHTAATVVTDNYDVQQVTRTSVMNNAGGTLNAQGTVMRIQNVATQTAGTLSDTVTVLTLTQDTDSTGAALSITGGSLTHAHRSVFTPKANQSLAAGSAIVVTDTTVAQISGSGGAVTLTSTPTIASGTDGQIVYIVGTDDTNTVTVQDQANLASSNLQLSGGNNFTIGLGDVLGLVFSSTVGDWIEFTRSDN